MIDVKQLLKDGEYLDTCGNTALNRDSLEDFRKELLTVDAIKSRYDSINVYDESITQNQLQLVHTIKVKTDRLSQSYEQILSCACGKLYDSLQSLSSMQELRAVRNDSLHLEKLLVSSSVTSYALQEQINGIYKYADQYIAGIAYEKQQLISARKESVDTIIENSLHGLETLSTTAVTATKTVCDVTNYAITQTGKTIVRHGKHLLLGAALIIGIGSVLYSAKSFTFPKQNNDVQPLEHVVQEKPYIPSTNSTIVSINSLDPIPLVSDSINTSQEPASLPHKVTVPDNTLSNVIRLVQDDKLNLSKKELRKLKRQQKKLHRKEKRKAKHLHHN